MGCQQKHNGDEITKRAEKVRSNIKREEAIELETTRILEVGRSRLCLKQILYDFKEAHQQINLEPKSIVLKSNVHRFGVPQIDISSIKYLNFKFLSLKLCIKNKFMDRIVNNNWFEQNLTYILRTKKKKHVVYVWQKLKSQFILLFSLFLLLFIGSTGPFWYYSWVSLYYFSYFLHLFTVLSVKSFQFQQNKRISNKPVIQLIVRFSKIYNHIIFFSRSCSNWLPFVTKLCQQNK